MRVLLQKLFFIITIQLFFYPNIMQAKGRFGEIVINLRKKSMVYYTSDQDNNAVIIHFKNTSLADLEPLNLYDERLIKRLLIKDLGAEGLKVTVYLKDRGLKVAIKELEEPNRLSLTLFEKSYSIDKD